MRPSFLTVLVAASCSSLSTLDADKLDTDLVETDDGTPDEVDTFLDTSLQNPPGNNGGPSFPGGRDSSSNGGNGGGGNPTDTGDTALGATFLPVEFGYFIQLGHGANEQVTDFGFAGNRFATGIFVNLYDAAGNDCTFGYLLDPDVVSSVSDTTAAGLTDMPAGLATWLDANDLLAGFEVTPTNYTPAPPTCTIDPSSILAADPHGRLLEDGFGTPGSMYVGIDDVLGADFADALQQTPTIMPTADFWTGGLLRLPYQITTTNNTTGQTTVTNDFELGVRTAEVDASMMIQTRPNGDIVFVERADMTQAGRAISATYLAESFFISL